MVRVGASSTDPTHFYKAEVRDVIDADTLLLDIDLGFEVIRRQSIRLARIDAPPRETPEGAAGCRFVRTQLAVARTVVVNTRNYDIHRRYVAHESSRLGCPLWGLKFRFSSIVQAQE